MLLEFKNVYQPEAEPKRRWFCDDFFDLIVWYDESNKIFGFQLCYDKPKNQKAVTWIRPMAYFHVRVDDGENRPGHYKAAPMLAANGVFDHAKIAQRFNEESALLDPTIARLVLEKLLRYH